MKKRIMVILLICFLSKGIFVAEAESVYDVYGDPRRAGENLEWELDDDGTLTISGTGEMTDFDMYGRQFFTTRPWENMTDSIRRVVVENGVTTVGEYAFINCNQLTSVQLPPSIETIREGAFFKCTSLESIDLPEGIIDIQWIAFYGCERLKNVRLPSTLTYMMYDSFNGCGIVDISIPDGLSVIDMRTFQNNQNLRTVHLPHTISEIGSGAFSECPALSDIYYPGTLAEAEMLLIGSENACRNKANWHCSDGDGLVTGLNKCGMNLQWVLDETGTLTISGTGAMSDYESGVQWMASKDKIRRVVVEQGVTAIGDGAFSFCSNLEKIDLPESLRTLGPSALKGSSLTSITLPDGLEIIGKYAFFECEALKAIILPNTLKEIGGFAFYGCEALEHIELPDGITEIGDHTFCGCGNLKSVRLPNTLTSMPYDMFVDCALYEITIPEGISEINNGAFSRNMNLTTVYLPSSLKTIVGSIFPLCPNLTDIYYAGTRAEAEKIVIGEKIIRNGMIWHCSDGDGPVSGKDFIQSEWDGNG